MKKYHRDLIGDDPAFVAVCTQQGYEEFKKRTRTIYAHNLSAEDVHRFSSRAEGYSIARGKKGRGGRGGRRGLVL